MVNNNSLKWAVTTGLADIMNGDVSYYVPGVYWNGLQKVLL